MFLNICRKNITGKNQEAVDLYDIYMTLPQVGFEAIKISCSFSAQLSVKFFLLINVKMQTLVGSLLLFLLISVKNANKCNIYEQEK